jgi:hypothetical protein
MASTPLSPRSHRPGRGPLSTAMITLAGTPDHSPSVDGLALTIARLSAERVAAARFASVTALRGKAYTTVALSDDLAKVIDEVQYADNAGPCLDALDSGAPVGVPDIDKTLQWPDFHEVAPRMGLQASVSVPLYAGRGEAIAVLNIYSHDRGAMAPVIAAICAVHGHRDEATVQETPLSGMDAGGLELVAGYTEALDIRATIRLAIGLIMTRNDCGADDAYLSLCIQAGDAGTDLADAAAALVHRGI